MSGENGGFSQLCFGYILAASFGSISMMFIWIKFISMQKWLAKLRYLDTFRDRYISGTDFLRDIFLTK